MNVQLAGQVRLEAAGVSAREAETLEAIGQRLSNREIAARMVISVRTVESHVSALLRKLGLPDRSALVHLAQQLPGEQALPVSATSFVGRAEELAEVTRMLGAGPLVSLVGPGGCGKTRLAVEAARRWPGAVRMVGLAAATDRDVGALVAAGLGIGYEARDMVAAARVALAGQATLLIVDNCEHVITAAGAVLAALARGVPRLRILATSREPLGADAEQVLPVRPLPAPHGTSPEAVRASASGQLFLDRARAASPRFGLDEGSAPHIAAICRHLDGLPLAIELAAARVRSLDVMELADSMQHRPGVLEQHGRTGRHRSLSSAIEWSWRLLDDTERGLLRRLAVLPGDFTLALAQEACADAAGADVGPVLMRLVEQSLVSVRLSGGEPARYRLLAVIRAFVLAHPDPRADGQVARAHAVFFGRMAAEAVRVRYHTAPGGPPAPGYDEPNLLAALSWSAGQGPDLADRLLASVSQLAETEPSRQALELIGDVASRRPPDWSSEALARASVALSYLSLEHADMLARKSEGAAVSERDQAFASWASGWVHAYRREESPAVRRLNAAISYATAAGDPWLEGSSLQARGIAREEPRDAFADWERAVGRFVAAGDLIHANNARYMLASEAVETRTRLGDVPVWLDECESCASRQGLVHELAHIRRVRAGYLLLRDDPGAARKLLEEAFPVFRDAGDFRCIARTLLDLARPPLSDDPVSGTDLLIQGLGAAAIASGPAMHAPILTRLIATAAAAGDLALAARCLGALDRLGQRAGRAATGPPVDPDLGRTLRGAAYATFVDEGRTGGIDLITTRYPR